MKSGWCAKVCRNLEVTNTTCSERWNHWWKVCKYNCIPCYFKQCFIKEGSDEGPRMLNSVSITLSCIERNNSIAISSISCIEMLEHFSRQFGMWWHHQMETFSKLLDLCAGNSLVTSEFPPQRPLTQSFDVFFDMCLNKRRVNIWDTGDLTHYDVTVMKVC